VQNIQNKYVALTVKLYKSVHMQQNANLKDKVNFSRLDPGRRIEEPTNDIEEIKAARVQRVSVDESAVSGKTQLCVGS
jgi:hypothetical protein